MYYSRPQSAPALLEGGGRENRVAISNRRVYAAVITRLKHRLECCPARAFAPDDQGRIHLKRMDSNRNLTRRATPRRRRSLSTALARQTFSAPTTSAQPKAPPRYRRARRKRPLLFRRPQRSIGSVAKENNPRGKARHVTRRYHRKACTPSCGCRRFIR